MIITDNNSEIKIKSIYNSKLIVHCKNSNKASGVTVCLFSRLVSERVHLSLNKVLAELTIHSWLSTAASFLISLKALRAVCWLRWFSLTQTLSSLPSISALFCSSQWQAGTPLPQSWHPLDSNMFFTSFTLCFAPLPDQGQRPGHRQICTCEAKHPMGLKKAVNFV